MSFNQAKWIALVLVLSPVYGMIKSSQAVSTGNYEVTPPNPTVNSNGTSPQASLPQNAPTPASKFFKKNKGVAYGFVRPTSTDAIRKYQSDHGLDVTGVMDSETTQALDHEQGETHDSSISTH